MDSADDTAITEESPLRIDGRVACDGAFPVNDLIELATDIDDGRPSIALVDVLARTRLSAHADVLVVSGDHPGSIALPVRAIVRQQNIRLLVDIPSEGAPSVLLAAPEWSDPDDPLVVRRVTALTFAEFVMEQ